MNKYSKPIVIVVLIIAALAVYYFVNPEGAKNIFRWTPKQGSMSAETASSTNAAVLNKLKSIVLLPDDVSPNMAIVTNAALLKTATSTAAFFVNAQDGDYLILYPNVAFLYDPNANKILNIGPVTNPVQVQAKTASTTKKTK
jgi:hypothetical protein